MVEGDGIRTLRGFPNGLYIGVLANDDIGG